MTVRFNPNLPTRKKMTAVELAAEWKSIAEQERDRADDAEAFRDTYKSDLERANWELYAGSLRARWARLWGR